MYPYFLSTLAEEHRGHESSALYRKISMASKRLQSLLKGNNHLWISNPEAPFIGTTSAGGHRKVPIPTRHPCFFPILDRALLGKARKTRSMLEGEPTL
jgi:hypothetical protein